MPKISKTICPNCQKEIEDCLEICPYCKKETNFDNPKINHCFPWVDFKRQISISLVGSVGLTVIATFLSTIAIIICSFFLKDVELKELENNVGFNLLINGLSYLAIAIALFFILKPYLKTLLKQFKSGKRILYGLFLGGILIGLSSLYSYIISFFYTTGGNQNEQTVIAMVKNYPIIGTILLAIIGPICEELTYRLGIFSFFSRYGKTRLLPYLVTSLIFALIHFNFFVTSVDSLVNELINLPSYFISGLVLAYIYDHHGLSASIVAHVLNNALSVILIFVTIK